jgi:hypothetical protein
MCRLDPISITTLQKDPSTNTNKQRQASLFSGGKAGEKRDNSSGLDLTRISCCGRAVRERVLRKTGACLVRGQEVS